MKKVQKIERLSEDIFAPITTDETKLVNGGGRTASATISYNGGPDGSATIDFTF